MKRIFNYIIAGCSLMIAASCSDFIDKEPIDQISADRMFDNESNAKAAVNAIYRSMESPYYYGQAFIVIPEFAAGHLRHTASYPEFLEYEENRIRIDNPWALNIWTAIYATINASNLVIENVPGMTNVTSDAVKLQMIREAKFLRALSYFNLVRSFGDVPLLVTPTSSAERGDIEVSRTASVEVYNQIIEDLTDAANLPAGYASVEETKGKATQFAAKALLAKVYLYQKDYTRAAAYAKEVIDQGGYTLTTDYPSIWQAENSSESIFELQFDQQATNPLVTTTTWNGAATTFFAKTNIDDLFEDGDVREDFSIYTSGTNFYVGKYRNDNPATQNLTVLRLSEVFLIYAEAAARNNQSAAGDPYSYYKQIRDRAQITTADEVDFTLNTFITAVQEEKRRELIFEGEAWYDYTRTDLALTEMMIVPETNRYVFPIPQVERNLNTQLTQNSAYQ